MEHGTFRRHALSDNYSMAIEAAGGIPVMLPAHYRDIEAMLDRLDGVVITGGGDIDPSLYGQQAHEKTDGVDAERDAFELAIVQAAITRDLPLLGICRGLQMLNVALGGTLYQDVADLYAGANEHRQQALKIHHEEKFQVAMLTPGSHPLRAIVGDDQFEINSFHHQGIENLAEPLEAMATTADRLIEAVYHPGKTYCLAVQWHPEMLAPNHEEEAAIFRSLTEAAASYAAARVTREAAQPV
jgi:putative glutamine amidotransferase